MDIKLLKEILVEAGIYREENQKNFICKCILCGDHKSQYKQKHLYVSKDPKIPVCHCWLCNQAIPIPLFIKKLTGKKSIADKVISEDEIKSLKRENKSSSVSVKKHKQLIIPDINVENSKDKIQYISDRLNGVEINDDLFNILSSNFVASFKDFLTVNNLATSIIDFASVEDKELIENNYIGFLYRNQTMLFCRSFKKDSNFKFKKISIQKKYPEYLDYIKFDGNNKCSDTIVMGEGVFDVLSEKIYNFTKTENVRLYASGQSFSYSALLKSILYDEGLYKCNVIIISDNDKDMNKYQTFYKESKHVIKKFKLFYNKTGKDFSEFPVEATEIKFKESKFKRF